MLDAAEGQRRQANGAQQCGSNKSMQRRMPDALATRRECGQSPERHELARATGVLLIERIRLR